MNQSFSTSFKRWFAVLSLAVGFAFAANADVTIDGLTYALDSSSKTATVTGYDSSLTSGDLVIPAVIPSDGEDYSVTTIGDYAFYKCSSLTGTLTIPNSVISIGRDAFRGCSGFTGSLTIPDSVTSIGGGAFHSCSGFKGSLRIPYSVTSIGERAFQHCTGFTGSLTIPNSVTSIGDWTFHYCSGFTGSLTLGNSVTSIGNSAFYGCSGFTGSLIIPDSVTSIGAYAFRGCSGFTGSLTLGNSVKTIGYSAFYGCSGFTELNLLPLQVKELGKDAFLSSKFESIYCDAVSPLTTSGTSFYSWNYDNSKLFVPAEALQAYKTAYEWKNFKSINPIIINATGVTLSAQELTLLVGESNKLTATVEPENTTNKDITWASDNEAVATVTEDGTVTAVSAGVANITATCGDVSATCKVTVNPILATGVTLSATEHTMYVGETTTLTATVTPDDATNKGIMWVSSDDNVATVDENGLVIGISAGEVTIHAVAKDGSGVEATCKIIIKAKVSGDADGDDQLTIADIVIIVKKVVGIDTEGAILENMDMNGDGVITSTDVTLAVYYLNSNR